MLCRLGDNQQCLVCGFRQAPDYHRRDSEATLQSSRPPSSTWHNVVTRMLSPGGSCGGQAVGAQGWSWARARFTGTVSPLQS